jgi:hypothetical protein
LAQAPVFVPTGTLAATIDGAAVVFRTHANLVPEADAPEGASADVEARLGRLTGREVNGASFVVTEPLVVGGVTTFPATMTVALRAMVAPDDRSDRRELVIAFRVDPTSLAWEGDGVTVEYHPERWRATAHYQLLELHAFEVTRIEAVEPHALRVAGRLVATLAWREGAFQSVVDPTNTVELDVEFEAYPVTGDEVLMPLIDDAAGGG